jgi:hypothetical protein
MSPKIEMISLKTQVLVNSASPPLSASDASDDECSQECGSADELSEFSDGDFSDSDDSSEEEADDSDEDTDSESMAPAPPLEGPDAHSIANSTDLLVAEPTEASACSGISRKRHLDYAVSGIYRPHCRAPWSKERRKAFKKKRLAAERASKPIPKRVRLRGITKTVREQKLRGAVQVLAQCLGRVGDSNWEALCDITAATLRAPQRVASW